MVERKFFFHPVPIRNQSCLELVLTVFGVIGYIWDRLTFVPWYFLSGTGRKLELARRIKVRVDHDKTFILGMF